MVEDVFSYIDQLCKDLDVSADNSDLMYFDQERFTRINFYSSKGTNFSLLFSDDGLELKDMGYKVTLKRDFRISYPTGIALHPLLDGVEDCFSVKYDVIVINKDDLIPILKRVISSVDLVEVVAS